MIEFIGKILCVQCGSDHALFECKQDDAMTTLCVECFNEADSEENENEEE